MGPSEGLAGRLYSASAIGLALALYGLMKLSLAKVRAAVSPMAVTGATAVVTWLALRRWCRDVSGGRLFPRVRRVAGRPREVAEAAAASLAAYAVPAVEPPPLWVSAFHGAARA